MCYLLDRFAPSAARLGREARLQAGHIATYKYWLRYLLDSFVRCTFCCLTCLAVQQLQTSACCINLEAQREEGSSRRVFPLDGSGRIA